jgi:thiosulfate reductase cytochrome b subunit
MPSLKSSRATERVNITNKQLRVWFRWIHIVGAWLIGGFVYSPGRDAAWYVLTMQVGVIPILILTGLVMWKQALAGRWINAVINAVVGGKNRAQV